MWGSWNNAGFVLRHDNVEQYSENMDNVQSDFDVSVISASWAHFYVQSYAILIAHSKWSCMRIEGLSRPYPTVEGGNIEFPVKRSMTDQLTD